MTDTLPRSLDVIVNVSKAQTAIATDMTLSCLLSNAVGFDRLDRFQVFNTFEAFEDVIDSTHTAWWAGNAFFSQTERPASFAVGMVFDADQPAIVVGGQGIDISSLTSITDGSMVIQVGATATTLTGLDFHSCADLDDVVTVLGSLFTANGTGVIATSAADGVEQIAAYAVAHTSGTDVSALLKLTASTAAGKESGYDYVSLEDEANRVQDYAVAAGRRVYGWVLDSEFRVTADQETFAAWVAANERNIAVLCTNEPGSLVAATTTDLASELKAAGNEAVAVVYHDNEQSFPDVSYMAKLIGTDYNGANTAMDMKFKNFPGIDTVAVTETQLSALLAKRGNVLTNTRDSRVVRDGTNAAVGWQSAVRVDVDNFVEEIQTAVFNVFLKNRKIPYTYKGQMLLVSAAQNICNKYIRNGVFADRRVEDEAAEDGYSILPACKAIPVAIETATDSMRNAHIGPPIQITGYLSGSIHKVTINVAVVE